MIRDILVQFQAPMQNLPVFVYGNSAAFSTATGSVSLSSTQAGDYVLAVISSTSPSIFVPARYPLQEAKTHPRGLLQVLLQTLRSLYLSAHFQTRKHHVFTFNAKAKTYSAVTD